MFTFDLIKIQVQKDRKTQKEPKTNLYNQNMQKQRQIYIVFISLNPNLMFHPLKTITKEEKFDFSNLQVNLCMNYVTPADTLVSFFMLGVSTGV